MTLAAGAYTENVTISRSVNLKGAKANSNVNSRTFGNGAESTVTGMLTINAVDVKVDGFSLTNPNNGTGVLVKTPGNNAQIKNNIVDSVGGVSFSSNATGIYLEYGPDNVTVEKNKITNISSTPTAQGILVGDSTSGNPSLGIRISKNTITNITSTRGTYGVIVNNGARSDVTATGYTTIKIRENTINGLSGNWAHAIGLEGDTPNAVVSKNVISNIVDINPVPLPDAIGVNFESNVFFFTADVSRNSLAVGNMAAGIFVNPALTTLYPSLEVDGTCNWWGDKTGPAAVGSGSGSFVGTNVDFKPWLKSSNINGRCGEKESRDDDNHHWSHDD